MMNNEIVNLKLNGRQLFHYQIKRFLGIPVKLPIDFSLLSIFLGNVLISVLSKRDAKFHFQSKHSSKFYHRVIAHCPECSTWVPAGKLQQHLGSKRCAIIKGEQEL
jgi:hypothetical protein